MNYPVAIMHDTRYVAILRDTPAVAVPMSRVSPVGPKGDPGGNIMSVGLYGDLDTSITVPSGTDLIQTSGWSDVGQGEARYAEFFPVGGEDVNEWRVEVNGGRWFRLAEPDLQLEHFGDVGTGNDDATWDAALDYLDRGRPLGRGGRIRVGNYQTTIGTTKVWDDMPVVIEGEVGCIQPASIGSRIKCAAGVTAFNPRNGATGQGGNSAFRNLRFTGQGGAVSLANADNGIGCAILAQAGSMVIENCVVQDMPGHAIVVKTGYPATVAGLNTNNSRMVGVRMAGSLRSGLVMRGVDSNVWELTKLDLNDNAEYGLDIGSFLGNSGRALHFAGNGTNALIIRNTSSYNRLTDLYKETDGKPSLKIEADSGPSVASLNVVEWAINSDGYDITGATGRNYISDNGHWNQLQIAGAPGDPDIILKDQLVRLVRGLIIQMGDDPLTTFWQLQVLAGKLHISSGSGNDLAIDNPVSVSGAVNTGATFKVAGNSVVGSRGAALPADATDLATAIALANAIKARIKKTGGHGLVED